MKVTLCSIETAQQAEPVKVLMEEYAASLHIDLQFQHFQEELRQLPGHYAAPGGALFLARADGEPAGCAALHRLSSCRGELKRLFVKPAFRHEGVGDQLIRAVLKQAVQLSYRYVRLDTLPSMAAAQKLYEKFGFYDIDPYVYNPVKDARYMEADLQTACGQGRLVSDD